MNYVEIRCQVSPGLFESEYFVRVNGRSAYYVNRANVQVNPQPTTEQAVAGRVRGYKVDQLDNLTLVQLPGEVVTGGLRTWVENDAVFAVA